MDALQLLEQYANNGSEAAFEALVKRHSSLVYSSARRRAGADCADDVTQAVFLILARKARQLCRQRITNLASWLYRATRYAASEARRGTRRREERERLAQERCDTMDTRQEQESLLPLLDAALDSLGSRDREAVLLRFFQDASFFFLF